MKSPILFFLCSVLCFSLMTACEDDDAKENNGADIVTFRVYTCNLNWSAENPEQGTPQPKATIKIYDENEVLHKTLTTDSKGETQFSLTPGKIFYYTAEYQDSHNLFEGMQVLGVFTSQDEIDNYPSYTDRFIGCQYVGSLKFTDINGDGIINALDSVQYALLNEGTTIEIVHLVPKSHLLTGYLELTDESMELFHQDYYTKVQQIYADVDYMLSELEQRTQLYPGNGHLWVLWSRSYLAIQNINSLLALPNMQSPKEKIQEYKASLEMYRACAYFYLLTAFGNIPLQPGYGEQKSQAQPDEVRDFISNGFDAASALMPITSSEIAELYYIKALYLVQSGNIEGASCQLDASMNSGQLKWIDSGDNTLFVRTNLLYAELMNETGHQAEAINAMNRVFTGLGQGLITMTTTAELREQIRSAYTNYDSGLRFINKARWGELQDWPEIYRLLPIPFDALIYNPNLKQNPGWN